MKTFIELTEIELYDIVNEAYNLGMQMRQHQLCGGHLIGQFQSGKEHLDDWFNSKTKQLFTEKEIEFKKCPKCNSEELSCNSNLMLASLPPRLTVKCNNCNHVFYPLHDESSTIKYDASAIDKNNYRRVI